MITKDYIKELINWMKKQPKDENLLENFNKTGKTPGDLYVERINANIHNN